MWNIIVALIGKVAVAVAPAIFSWIGNEALSLIAAHVSAENAKRAAGAGEATVAKITAAEAKAEAAAPATQAELVQTLKQGAF